MRWIMVAALALASCPAWADPFDELNAQRAHWGLPPARYDYTLSKFAQQKAEWQAAHDIRLQTGYNGHEGPQNPWGFVEGTGCLEPSAGWATCATRTVGSPLVGVGMAMGQNGLRYMCLIVAAKDTRDGGVRRPLLDTSGLTSGVPVIARRPMRPRRGPRGRAWVPIDYAPLGPPSVVWR